MEQLTPINTPFPILILEQAMAENELLIATLLPIIISLSSFLASK